MPGQPGLIDDLAVRQTRKRIGEIGHAVVLSGQHLLRVLAIDIPAATRPLGGVELQLHPTPRDH